MDIFIFDTENNKEILRPMVQNDIDKVFRSESRKIQYCAGRFLTKYLAENFYNSENINIEIKNKKPFFKDSDLHFNISHSNNYVVIAFDKNPVGVDIEYAKERDFAKILKHYNVPMENAKELFYRFWTEYEAKLKLQEPKQDMVVFKYTDEFYIAAASTETINLKIYEIKNNLTPVELNLGGDCFFQPLNVNL